MDGYFFSLSWSVLFAEDGNSHDVYTYDLHGELDGSERRDIDASL